MDEKITQKLDETAEKIGFGSYVAEFVIDRGRVVKVIIKQTSEVVLYRFDKIERK